MDIDEKVPSIIAKPINLIDIACNQYKMVENEKKPKFNKLGLWLNKESSIFLKECFEKTTNYPKFKRGEIIKIDFGINVGTELSHTHYAIVINSDDTTHNDNITVLPISSKNGYKRIELGEILLKAMPSTKKYNKNCYAMLTQIKTVSKKRIFNDNFRYICCNDILDKIDKELISFLTKQSNA